MEAQAYTQTTPNAGGLPFGVQATAARAASLSPWKLSIWGWKISTEPFSTPMTRGHELVGGAACGAEPWAKATPATSTARAVDKRFMGHPEERMAVRKRLPANLTGPSGTWH